MVEVVKYGATGRRKSSVARVFMKSGKGNIIINDKLEDALKEAEDIVTNFLKKNRSAHD